MFEFVIQTSQDQAETSKVINYKPKEKVQATRQIWIKYKNLLTINISRFYFYLLKRHLPLELYVQTVPVLLFILTVALVYPINSPHLLNNGLPVSSYSQTLLPFCLAYPIIAFPFYAATDSNKYLL